MIDEPDKFFNENKKYFKKLTLDFVKNILVIRQHNQMGDMICSLPLYAALKKKYPDAKITLVAAKTNYPLPFFDINPYLNNVIVFDKSSIKNIFMFYKKLRKMKYQIGIVPSTVKISRNSHLINFFSGAKIRVGIKGTDHKTNSLGYLLNIKSTFHWDKNNTHQTERNLDVVKQFGCDLNENEKLAIKLLPEEEDHTFAQQIIWDNFKRKKQVNYRSTSRGRKRKKYLGHFKFYFFDKGIR